MKISRRDFWGVTVSLTSVQWLLAQDAQRKDSPAEANTVLPRVAVMDKDRYINGLDSNDSLVWEDRIRTSGARTPGRARLGTPSADRPSDVLQGGYSSFAFFSCEPFILLGKNSGNLYDRVLTFR